MSKNKALYYLLIVIVFLLYGKSMWFGYSMDDEIVVANNTLIQKGVRGLPEIFTSHYYTDRKYKFEYRPLVKASYAIEYQLWGANTKINHLINIMLYALGCCLLLSFLIQLFNNIKAYLILIACVLFVLHPLHTEVVCSLKNRDVLLAFLFSILSAIYYLKYSTSDKTKYLLYGGILSFIALLSKPDATVYFIIIPFVLFYFEKASRLQIIKILGAYTTVLLLFVCIVVFILDKDITRTIEYYENPLFFNSNFSTKLAYFFFSIGYYLKLLVVPGDLLCYYGYKHIDIAAYNNAFILIGIGFFVVFTFLTFKYFNKKNIAYASLLICALAIFPVLNLIYPAVGIIAERFAFNATVGFSMCSSFILASIFKLNGNIDAVDKKQNKTNYIALITAISIIYFSISFTRINAWKNTYTLYKTDILKAPNSIKLTNLYADACLKNYYDKNFIAENKSTQLQEAVKWYNHSLLLYPNQAANYNNLGLIYGGIYNQVDSAIGYFKKAANLDKLLPDYNFNIGYSYSLTNNYDSAFYYYKKAIAIDASSIVSYNAYTQMALKTNRLTDAIDLNKQALEKGIINADLYINLGNLFLSKKDSANALNYFKQSTQISAPNAYVSNIISVLEQKK